MIEINPLVLSKDKKVLAADSKITIDDNAAYRQKELAEAEENNKITHYRRKTRLCGCFMPAKVHFAGYRCPINKWGRYRLNEEETELLREFVSGLPDGGRIDAKTVKALNE